MSWVMRRSAFKTESCVSATIVLRLLHVACFSDLNDHVRRTSIDENGRGFPHLTQLPDDMSFSESDSEDGMEERRSPSPLPPHLLPLLRKKKKYVAELNALFAESRTRFHELRRIELENGNQLFDFPEPTHQNVRSQQQDEGAFQLVKGRKKGRSPTPPKDTATSLKKQKTTEVETSNQYDALPTYHGEENEDETEVPVHHNTVRPPPPITIDNVKLPNQLLKKLQDTTQQKMKGRMVGKGLRIYPETPEAYHAIRKYVETEKLEAFTYQLPEDREIKAVIRGMPADTPPKK
ncbi:hypothetical protein TNCV_3879941 [Trichonephila clavipes]|nr:hypothetical protein TNCV_3879941 [Trichonephila clavipes]